MQQIVNVLSLGSIYALLTLGYALITGVMKFLNFAHADILVLGVYMMAVGKNPLIAVLVCAILNFLINGVYQKSEKLLTASLGVSLILQYTLMLIFSSQPKTSGIFFEVIRLGDIFLQPPAIMAFVTLLILTLALFLTLKFTRVGLYLRATADNPFAASLVGVYPKRVFGVCFLISGFLAGVGGVFYSLSYPVTPLLGGALSVKAFVCKTLGGNNSLVGAIFGGFLLAFMETAVSVFIGSGWRDIVTFAILIAVLIAQKDE